MIKGTKVYIMLGGCLNIYSNNNTNWRYIYFSLVIHCALFSVALRKTYAQLTLCCERIFRMNFHQSENLRMGIGWSILLELCLCVLFCSFFWGIFLSWFAKYIRKLNFSPFLSPLLCTRLLFNVFFLIFSGINWKGAFAVSLPTFYFGVFVVPIHCIYIFFVK